MTKTFCDGCKNECSQPVRLEFNQGGSTWRKDLCTLCVQVVERFIDKKLAPLDKPADDASR